MHIRRALRWVRRSARTHRLAPVPARTCGAARSTIAQLVVPQSQPASVQAPSGAAPRRERRRSRRPERARGCGRQRGRACRQSRRGSAARRTTPAAAASPGAPSRRCADGLQGVARGRCPSAPGACCSSCEAVDDAEPEMVDRSRCVDNTTIASSWSGTSAAKLRKPHVAPLCQTIGGRPRRRRMSHPSPTDKPLLIFARGCCASASASPRTSCRRLRHARRNSRKSEADERTAPAAGMQSRRGGRGAPRRERPSSSRGRASATSMPVSDIPSGLHTRRCSSSSNEVFVRRASASPSKPKPTLE